MQSGKLPQGKENVESELGSFSWQELVKFLRELSISDRLLLVDEINKYIRDEIGSAKAATSSVRNVGLFISFWIRIEFRFGRGS